MSYIKQSLKWGNNSKHRLNNPPAKDNWIHQPEALQGGHVAYVVKFLGVTEVDQPKGIDVVKEGIRKLKFSQQLKRSEGSKPPKVELTISVDGVAIQDRKNKKISHQYPLHRISYCADDKTDPKFFSFIAKEAEGDKHNCFVFISEKRAKEITLTIGQAFDLAYKRFLQTSGRDLEMKKQFMLLQKRVHILETENNELRSKLDDYEKNTTKKNHLYNNGDETGINGKMPPLQPPPARHHQQSQVNNSLSLLDLDLDQDGPPIVGRKLENLSLDDDNFDPRAETDDNTIGFNDNITSLDENKIVVNTTNLEKDAFGFKPFNNGASQQEKNGVDAFGMGKFDALKHEQAIVEIEKRIAEMRDGFNRGISFGNDDFSIEQLDPLH